MTDAPELPQLPMFAVTSDPLPMQPEMFTVLGEAVVHWSRIESGIETDIRMMLQWGVVKKLAEVMPHTFNKKLELWRRAVRALYPRIDAYQRFADEFTESAKAVAKIRNHLIHGTWLLEENDKGEFLVMNHRSVKGEDRVESLWVGQEILDTLLADVKKLSAAITGFTVTKMVHLHEGLVVSNRPPSPDHQAHPTPATPGTQQDQPEPSQE